MRRAGGTQGEAQHEEREDHAPSTRSARRQKRHARRDYDQNVVTSLKFSSPAAGLFLYPDDPRRRNFILIPSRFPKVIRYAIQPPRPQAEARWRSSKTMQKRIRFRGINALLARAADHQQVLAESMMEQHEHRFLLSASDDILPPGTGVAHRATHGTAKALW